jgi:hypothetical protein
VPALSALVVAAGAFGTSSFSQIRRACAEASRKDCPPPVLSAAQKVIAVNTNIELALASILDLNRSYYAAPSLLLWLRLFRNLRLF